MVPHRADTAACPQTPTICQMVPAYQLTLSAPAAWQVVTVGDCIAPQLALSTPSPAEAVREMAKLKAQEFIVETKLDGALCLGLLRHAAAPGRLTANGMLGPALDAGLAKGVTWVAQLKAHDFIVALKSEGACSEQPLLMADPAMPFCCTTHSLLRLH